MKIKSTCKGNRTIKLDQAINFQPDDLKKISIDAIEKLKTSLKKHGIFVPLFFWKNKDILIDGHHRVKALKELKKEGYEIDLLPVVDIEAKNEKEVAEKLLLIGSKYAKIHQEGFSEFVKMFNLEMSELDLSVDLPEINIDIENDFSDFDTKDEGEDNKMPDDLNNIEGYEDMDNRRDFIMIDFETEDDKKRILKHLGLDYENNNKKVYKIEDLNI